MKLNQVKTLALLILTFLSSSTYASHLLGGEITFFCVGGGNYKFRVTFYKNCAEIPFNDPTLTVTAFGVTGLNSANITCNLVGTPIDISPQCTQVTGGPGPVRCTNGPTGRTLGAYGAVSRFVYESGPINFNNVPAPGVGTPYIFFTNIGGCCRYSNNNTDCGGAGALMLRCLMYRYEKNGVGVPPSLLCDKAPEFVIIPSTAQIISNTDTVVIQNFAIDNDLDSLAYAIDYPLINYNNGLGVNCNYVNNYSLNYPFPTVLPVNYKGVSYPMNPVTGDVLYKPNVYGDFLTSTRVESWRCGQKISEIYRDFQVIIMAPPPNYPSTVQKNPKLVPPFSDNLGNPNTSWSASFFAGDSIVFNLEANDYQNSSQVISLFTHGIQNAPNSVDSMANACLYPPCAYLKGNLSNLNQNPDTIFNKQSGTIGILGYGFRSVIAVGTTFIWPTNCKNALTNNCLKMPMDYLFKVTARDDQCPANGLSTETVHIKLYPEPVLNSPNLLAVNAVSNGIKIRWIAPIENKTKEIPDSNLAQSVKRRENTFKKYLIYRQSDGTGYVLIDSLLAVFAGDKSVYNTTYIDKSKRYNDGHVYSYKVAVVYGCQNTISPLSNGKIARGIAVEDKNIPQDEIRRGTLGTNPISNTVNTTLINLDASFESDWTNKITWNGSTIFDPKTLALQRKVGNNEWLTISVNLTTDNFKDDILSINDSSGTFCYRIVSSNLEQNNGVEILSNTNCLQLKPTFFIANTFIPDGITQRFGAKISYIDAHSFKMEIYDSNKLRVFESHKKDDHWNGLQNNVDSPCKQGFYYWKINYTGIDGKNYTQAGTVKLIR